jgi:hypothetical protein
MRILVLHRVPYEYISYHLVIDHLAHEVVYVGTAEQLRGVPADVRCVRVERPGVDPLVQEVLARVEGPFDRVITMSQFEVVEAAQLRATWGVPGSLPEDVARVDDKVEMKRAVAARGLRAPRFARCDEILSGQVVPDWSGPTILKPVNGTASEGVERTDSVEAALVALAGRTGADPARHELEEFVPGPVLHFDGLMLDGELVLAVMGRYGGSCLAYAHGAPITAYQVDDDGGRCSRILPFLLAVGLVNGPFHLEMFDTPDGLVFLEVAARSGGAAITERVRLATGVDLVAAELIIAVDPSPLATHPQRAALEGRTSGLVYGELLIPGHTLPSRYCRVSGVERFRAHPSVVRWCERAPTEPLATEISYYDYELPLSATVSGRTTADVVALLDTILAEVRIESVEAP